MNGAKPCAPIELPNGQRIAFIVDSCCDVLPSYLEQYPFFVAPMNIAYTHESFEDRVTIQPDEVYARFATEIPKTSTPTPAAVHRAFDNARFAGATHVLCFAISSALSGTYALMEATAFDYPDLHPCVIDTLNIGIGSGITAMYAAELALQGLDTDTIAEVCRDIVPCTRIFIIPDTLEYLYKGGRISHAVYQIGQVLNMRPIITCDKNGYYAVAAKARGRKKSIAKAVQLAQASVLPDSEFRVVMANGMAQGEMDALLADAPLDFPLAKEVIDGGNLSPALVVHTGPGLLGIVVQNLV